MKIRHKLSFSFSLVATLILLMLGCVVYFFSSQYRKNEFNNRLKQRIDVTEKMFLEKANFSAGEFKLIQDQFLNKLPEETEEVLPLTSDFKEKLMQSYTDEFLQNLIERKEAFFQGSNIQGGGKIFHVNGQDYLVLLTAVDVIGMRMMDHLLSVIVVALALCMVIMIGVSYLMANYILNPISQKIKAANSISAQNLQERIEVHDKDDELDQLGMAYNNLLDRVEQAFETQRQFIDNASHEIRNPLTAIMGESEVALEKERTKEEYIDSLKSVATEADRLNTLVNNLLKLSNISYKQVSFSRELIDLKDILKTTAEKFTFLNPDNQIRLHFEHTSTCLTEGNYHLLETAFLNLFDNASKFSFNQEVKVTLQCHANGLSTISILDRGVGIPPEDIPKITQPFHRAENVRKIQGVGIGIPLTLKIIELHNGTLEFESRLNEGTAVRVNLPVLTLG